MILNIDGFNSTPTDIKKFGAGALMLKNQETLLKISKDKKNEKETKH